MRGRQISARGIVGLSAAAAFLLAAWWLPNPKPEAIDGRLSYGQFLLALLAGAGFVSTAIVVLTPPARRRAIGFRLAAAWLGMVAAGIAVETAAYWLPSRHPMDNPWYLMTGLGIEAGDDLPFERPAHLHWEGLSRGDLAILNGDADPYASRVTFVTDYEGFRNSEDQGEADLLFLGDSYTEAGNIPEDQTFVRQTATAVGRSARNLGRAGYSGPMELIVLRKYGLKCRPRAVVWQVAESNDLNEAAMFQDWLARGRPAGTWAGDPPSRADSWKQRSPTWRLFAALRRPRPWPVRATFRDREGQVHPIRLLGLPGAAQCPFGHPGWPVLADSFRQGAKLLREQKTPLIVLLVPEKARALAPRLELEERLQAEVGPNWDLPESVTLATRLRGLCDELDVPFVDATPALRQAAAAGDLVYLPFDTHLSVRGHEVIRDILLAPLRKACP